MKKAAIAALLLMLPLAAAAEKPGQERRDVSTQSATHETHARGADQRFFGSLHRNLGKWAHGLHSKLRHSAPGRCKA